MPYAAIPPNAREVWINPDPKADLLATFVDSKGRKQYRYHPRVIRQRQRRKFTNTRAMTGRVTRLRLRVERDLARRRLSRHKVAALVVRLIDTGFFRVGSERYAKDNETYGICSLRRRHIHLTKSEAVIEFISKRQVPWKKRVADHVAIDILNQLVSLPGESDTALFVFLERGETVPVTSNIVNRYLSRFGMTAKDLRTYHATRLVAEKLLGDGEPKTDKEHRRRVALAIQETAHELGHTPGICRRNYVDPLLLRHYAKGNLRYLARYSARVPRLEASLGLAGRSEAPLAAQG